MFPKFYDALLYREGMSASGWHAARDASKLASGSSEKSVAIDWNTKEIHRSGWLVERRACGAIRLLSGTLSLYAHVSLVSSADNERCLEMVFYDREHVGDVLSQHHLMRNSLGLARPPSCRAGFASAAMITNVRILHLVTVLLRCSSTCWS